MGLGIAMHSLLPTRSHPPQCCSRWDMDRFYSPDAGGFYARFAAFCAGVDLFDAAAFRMADAEALALDPQVR